MINSAVFLSFIFIAPGYEGEVETSKNTFCAQSTIIKKYGGMYF